MLISCDLIQIRPKIFPCQGTMKHPAVCLSTFNFLLFNFQFSILN